MVPSRKASPHANRQLLETETDTQHTSYITHHTSLAEYSIV